MRRSRRRRPEVRCPGLAEHRHEGTGGRCDRHLQGISRELNRELIEGMRSGKEDGQVRKKRDPEWVRTKRLCRLKTVPPANC